MPRLRTIGGRRIGTVSVALTLWDLWRRLPPEHRKRLLDEARTQGPRLARKAYDARRKRPR